MFHVEAKRYSLQFRFRRPLFGGGETEKVSDAFDTLYIRESVTSGNIGVRPRLRSYLDALNGRSEIRPVVIDDRNAPVAQVSLASLE